MNMGLRGTRAPDHHEIATVGPEQHATRKDSKYLTGLGNLAGHRGDVDKRASRAHRDDLGRSLFPPPGKTEGRAAAIQQIDRDAGLAAKAAPRPKQFAAGEDWRNGE